MYCRDELVMQEGDTGDEMYVHLGVPLKLRDGGHRSWVFSGWLGKVVAFFPEALCGQVQRLPRLQHGPGGLFYTSY